MRRRMILVLSLTLLGMLALLTAAANFIIVESYSALERRVVTRDVERALNTLRADLDVLSRTANDYAAWDETYEFAARRDCDYVRENLTDGVFLNLRLNVFVIVDAQGKLVAGRAFDLAAAAERPVSQSLLALLAGSSAFTRPGMTGGVTGIIHLPEGHLLAASRPVTDNSEAAPPRGSLLMGRYLDEAEMARIGERLGLLLSVAAPDDSRSPADIRRAFEELAEEGPIVVRPLSASRIAGYAFLHGAGSATDADGPHGMVLKVDDPREIAVEGMRSLLYLVGSLLLIAMVFGLVVILYIERTILSRIIVLSRGVLSLGSGAAPGRRVAVEGRDQVAYLGAAINGMLDALESSTRRSEAFLDAIPDTIFRIDREGNIIDARSPTRLPLVEAADALVGTDAEQIVQLYPFISPERLERSIEATSRALETGVTQSMEFDVEVDGIRRSFEERVVASGSDEAVALVRDVTAAKQAAEAQRKEILLREIHHRVKNNLQVISSLLALQAGAAEDPRTKAMLAESRDRVRSMALIHEKLYQTGAERGVTFGEYVRDLAAHLRHSYAADAAGVQIDVAVDELELDMDISVPCGLIINELLSNALRHAFPAGRAGRIRVAMHRVDGMLELTVSDDGVGLPPGVDLHAPRTLGMRIVSTLAAQIRASLEKGDGPGTTLILRFPGA